MRDLILLRNFLFKLILSRKWRTMLDVGVAATKVHEGNVSVAHQRDNQTMIEPINN